MYNDMFPVSQASQCLDGTIGESYTINNSICPRQLSRGNRKLGNFAIIYNE